MSPGPDTTRQAPGLDTSNHRRQCKVQTDPSCSHYSFQLLNVLPPSEVSNGRCCITCLLSDRIYCILIYHCSYSHYLQYVASRSLGGIVGKTKILTDKCYSTYSKLYQTCVCPVLDYLSEIWGYKRSPYSGNSILFGTS